MDSAQVRFRFKQHIIKARGSSSGFFCGWLHLVDAIRGGGPMQCAQKLTIYSQQEFFKKSLFHMA